MARAFEHMSAVIRPGDKRAIQKRAEETLSSESQVVRALIAQALTAERQVSTTSS
jgi:hypothetical protein